MQFIHNELSLQKKNTNPNNKLKPTNNIETLHKIKTWSNKIDIISIIYRETYYRLSPQQNKTNANEPPHPQPPNQSSMTQSWQHEKYKVLTLPQFTPKTKLTFPTFNLQIFMIHICRREKV